MIVVHIKEPALEINHLKILLLDFYKWNIYLINKKEEKD